MESTIATAPRPISEHILRETRRLIAAGWLKDGKHVIPAGITAGRELFDVASRTPGHPMHRVELDHAARHGRCDCRGYSAHGRCTHVLLARCFVSDTTFNAVYWPHLPAAEA